MRKIILSARLQLFGRHGGLAFRAPAAAALRSCGAMVGVLRLPKVPASNGVRSVIAHHQMNRVDRNMQFVGY